VNSRREKVRQMKELLKENARMGVCAMADRMKVPVSTAYDVLQEIHGTYDMRVTFRERAAPKPACPRCGKTQLTYEIVNRLKLVKCGGCHESFLRSQLSRKLKSAIEKAVNA